MKTRSLTCLVCLLGAPFISAAEPVQLRAPTTLNTISNTPVLPGTYATPFVTDWNGDGRKDLLIGYQNVSKIAVYTNTGTDAQPIFTTGYNLECRNEANTGWRHINHPSGGCGAPAPWVCDFDADGKRDLLVGAGHDGSVWLYRNINTDAQPLLANPVQLTAGGANILVGSRANVCVTDWNDDGLPDMVVGGGDGRVHLFLNSNTTREPRFAAGALLEAGGTNLFVNVQVDGRLNSTPRAVPRVLDWDGDGLKDLLCSSDVGIFWCRNTNSNQQPILDGAVRVCAPTTSGYQPVVTATVPGARMRVFPTDWNNDGVMDLLLGNADGTIYFYEGYRFGITRICRLPDHSTLLDWNSTSLLTYNVLVRDASAAEWTQAATNLTSTGKSMTWVGAPEDNARARLYRVEIAW